MTTAELAVQSRGARAGGGSHEVVWLGRGREAVRDQTACVGHTGGGGTVTRWLVEIDLVELNLDTSP
jgi:hypothetical protein